MKTHNTDTSYDIQTPPTPSPIHSKINRWLSVASAFVVVALVVGLSAVVFAQLGGTHRGNHTATQPGTVVTTKPPVTGHWEQVLKGYSIASVVAAQSNPAVLYACATKSGSNSSGVATYTVLRSTDFGNSWQDVASKEGLSTSCQLTINPTDSNELLALGAANPNNVRADILKHSADGGQTWETIQPTLKPTNGNRPSALRFMQISFAGKHLFALQWLPQQFIPEGSQNAVPQAGLLPNLVTSIDGGRTWTIVENPLRSAWQGVRDYAVDLAHTSTIYELLGGTRLPFVPESALPPGGDVQPAFNSTADLYKTVDGGATWHLLLKNLPFGSQLQLAQGNPQFIYVGGSTNMLGLAERPLLKSGLFQLQMSSDGGTRWQQVAVPLPVFGPPSWFVSANGQVYLTPFRYGGPPSPAAVIVPTQSIQRYDPFTNMWSEVTKTLTPGTLVAVTPVDAHSSVALWFLSTVGTEQTLSRYIV